MNILEQLLGKVMNHPSQPVPQAQPAAPHLSSMQDIGRQLLGYRPAAPDMATPKVYAPIVTPTPQVLNSLKPALQVYGDSSGNRWFENDSGQHIAMPQAPQRYDAPLNNSYRDQLRPGQRGAYPVNDGVAHLLPQTQRQPGRII